MMMDFRQFAGAAVAFSFLGLATASQACDADVMAVNENGFILKVVAGSDKIPAFVTPDSEEEVFTLGLLQPYFVICESGGHYKITDLPAGSVDEALTGNVAFVEKAKVFEWPTREALTFNTLIFDRERPEVRAWEDSDALDKFMETGDRAKYPPAFEEDIESTLKRPRDTRPYPVLSSNMRLLRKTKEKRVFKALIPAALPPETVVVVKDKEGAAAAVDEIVEVQQRATFVVVFDATGSMEGVARDVARDLIDAFKRLEGPQASESRVGFVFFRDEADSEKLAMSSLMPIPEASDLLVKASDRMVGGGDTAEPILDATYVALHHFPWDAQGAGKKILIGVLNGDAKPETTGRIDGRVPAGIDAVNLVASMQEEGVTMVTMQASADAGPNLKDVLDTLAVGTGGEFVEWKPGDARGVTSILTRIMTEKAAEEAEAAVAIRKEISEFEDYPAIPLKVLDGERLERLRRAGLEFNIEDGADGVLVREAFLIENEDLLEPRIQIEKETLTGLINLFSILGTTGVDADAMIESVGEAIAAIAGEEFDSSEKLDAIITKTLGIQFRSGILSFDIEYLSVLNPGERLKFTKRIQEGGNKLSDFLEANQAEFDTQPAVWMPISVLP